MTTPIYLKQTLPELIAGARAASWTPVPVYRINFQRRLGLLTISVYLQKTSENSSLHTILSGWITRSQNHSVEEQVFIFNWCYTKIFYHYFITGVYRIYISG